VFGIETAVGLFVIVVLDKGDLGAVQGTGIHNDLAVLGTAAMYLGP
jgi:hypothetical protein